MAEDDASAARRQSWWQTMPGMMTGIAALITALTGLLLAAHQMGLLGPSASPTTKSARPDKAPMLTATTATPRQGALGSGPATGVEFDVPKAVSLGKGDEVAFTFTKATIESRNAETATLLVTVRMSNRGKYPANFWDQSFRLRTSDGNVAASGGLNEVVPGGAESSNGVLRFTVAFASAPSALQIEYGGETTQLPLRLVGVER